MSIVAGFSIDWYSSGHEHQDHLPGYLLSAAAFLFDFMVASQLKVLNSGPGSSPLACCTSDICFHSKTIFSLFIYKVPESDAPAENIVKDVGKVLKNAKMCIFLIWASAGGIFTVYIWYYFIW